MSADKPLSEKEMAARIGCDVRTIRNYKRQGAPIHDMEAMAKWLAGRKNIPAGAYEALKDYSIIKDLESAKIQKLILDCERAQLKLETERKKYIPAAEVKRDMLRIGNAMRAEMNRLKGEAPTWHDRTAVEIERLVAKFTDEMCRNLSDEFSALYE